MKELIERDEVPQYKLEILNAIKQGEIFIYPTDTLYGLGCDASNPEAVAKLREIKEQQDRPLSIIVPSKEWITENCDITPNMKEWLGKLPGPYTLIVPVKKDRIIKEVNLECGTVGVRMPKHWFTEILQESKVPIITTSVNRAGRHIMTSLDDMSKKIRSRVKFIVYEGEKTAHPSTLVDLKDQAKVIER